MDTIIGAVPKATLVQAVQKVRKPSAAPLRAETQENSTASEKHTPQGVRNAMDNMFFCRGTRSLVRSCVSGLRLQFV